MNKSQKLPTIVITAPSGAGKTTLTRRLTAEFDQIESTISYTTRPARKNEFNGRDYWFSRVEDFKAKLEKQEMIEWAEVFGNFYGTSFQEIERIQQAGHQALLEIDVQGWVQVKDKFKSSQSVFILPPSMDVLWSRLKNRGTDSFDVRMKRFLTAKKELERADCYQSFIVNDDLEEAYKSLVNLVIHRQPAQLSREDGIAWSKKLLTNFDKVAAKAEREQTDRP